MPPEVAIGAIGRIQVFMFSLLHHLGPVQTPLHSCAEPNWWIKSGKRAPSESIRYGSFNSVQQRCSVRQGLPHYSTLERQLIHTALFPCAEPNALIMTMYNLPMMYTYIRFDTQYAVWISCHANVAPKSNLIQLRSAHEWSGVWTGP